MNMNGAERRPNRLSLTVRPKEATALRPSVSGRRVSLRLEKGDGGVEPGELEVLERELASRRE